VLTDVEWASIAPGGEWALVTRDGRSSLVRGLAEEAPAQGAALIDSIDRGVWTRDASFAVVYSSLQGRLQRVKLARDASADAPIDLPAPGRLTALAIDPSGRRIAFGIAGSGLYFWEADQSPALLSAMAQPAAAAFDETGRRLYVADLETQRILEFDSGSGPVEFAALTLPDGATVNPAGLAVSGNGRYLMLADRAGLAVRVYDTLSRTLANTIALDFAPTRLEPLSSTPTFLLNGDAGNEWLLILDAREAPGVSFVPANREEPL
jgi:hypothetical protein